MCVTNATFIDGFRGVLGARDTPFLVIFNVKTELYDAKRRYVEKYVVPPGQPKK